MLILTRRVDETLVIGDDVTVSILWCYMKFNILQLKTAFDWTIQHFAELDMGGNCKWLGVALHILKQLKNDEWGVTQQNNLIGEYITDTRWYDY